MATLVQRSLMVATGAVLALGLAACGGNAEKTSNTGTPSPSASAMTDNKMSDDKMKEDKK